MSWIESRIIQAEKEIEQLWRALKDALAAITALRQGLKLANQRLPDGGAGGGGGVYVCIAPSAVSGTWSSGVPTSPGSFSATVYQCEGTTASSVGSKTVYNWLPAATVSGKACMLTPDGTGNFAVVSQSCV